MTPPEERHRYQEQIGAFLLGKLDGGELSAMQTHLSGCPVCQAEVRELEPVVAALADAAPDRIGEDPRPAGDLEELTLAPILGKIYRARRRRGRFQWSALAAAAICVVVIGLAGLAGFTGPLKPAAALEPLSFSVAPGMEVEGHLIEHAWGTEIRLVLSGSRDGQTHRVTLVSEDGERVNAGTFIGIGDEQLRGTFNAALLREDADRLEVRTPNGEPVFFAKLPEEPRDKVRDWPLFGILPWADPDLQNATMGPNGPDSTEGPSPKESAPPDTHEKPKPPGSGGETPPKESDPKRPSPGGGKPGAAPKESEPGSDLPGSPSPGSPSPEPSPACDQYECQP